MSKKLRTHYLNKHYTGIQMWCSTLRPHDKALWSEWLELVNCKACKEAEKQRRKEVAEYAAKRYEEQFG